MVRSGESNVRPREFAYLRKIRSRTSSTRSSSLIGTRVADAPGRFTQILRMTMGASDGATPSPIVVDAGWSTECTRLVCLFEIRLCCLDKVCGRKDDPVGDLIKNPGVCAGAGFGV
jgi:hypothetical protein